MLIYIIINRYEKPEVYDVVDVDLPKVRDNDVLMYVTGIFG